MDEKVILIEAEQRHLTEEISDIKKKVENIYELTMSVKEIATEMKAMREDMNKIDNRVKVIEEKPAKRYDSIITQLISIIVSAIAGFFIAKIGLK